MVGVSASSAGREPTMDPRPARSGSTVSILVVEDDHAVAELLRETFHDIAGWAATIAHDAAAARQVFEQVTIDVLLLDVNLPGISGAVHPQAVRPRRRGRHDPQGNSRGVD